VEESVKKKNVTSGDRQTTDTQRAFGQENPKRITIFFIYRYHI